MNNNISFENIYHKNISGIEIKKEKYKILIAVVFAFILFHSHNILETNDHIVIMRAIHTDINEDIIIPANHTAAISSDSHKILKKYISTNDTMNIANTHIDHASVILLICFVIFQVKNLGIEIYKK